MQHLAWQKQQPDNWHAWWAGDKPTSLYLSSLHHTADTEWWCALISHWLWSSITDSQSLAVISCFHPVAELRDLHTVRSGCSNSGTEIWLYFIGPDVNPTLNNWFIFVSHSFNLPNRNMKEKKIPKMMNINDQTRTRANIIWARQIFYKCIFPQDMLLYK